MAHIAESTHWYAPDGSPAYEVKGANGAMRPTTLRDARKFGYVPSVTTIIKCAAAPALERWKQEQILHAALTLPLIEGEAEADYLERIWKDSREQGKKAAERGTAIHAAIQGHYEGKITSEEYWPHIKGVSDALDKWWGDWPAFDIASEVSFCHPMGFGGKTDLAGNRMVVDFKTKEFNEDAKLATYDEHAMQLAAYREGLKMPDARCAIVYVSVIVPGLVRVMELEQEELKQGWEMFNGLMNYWYAKTGLKR